MRVIKKSTLFPLKEFHFSNKIQIWVMDKLHFKVFIQERCIKLSLNMILECSIRFLCKEFLLTHQACILNLKFKAFQLVSKCIHLTMLSLRDSLLILEECKDFQLHLIVNSLHQCNNSSLKQFQ